MFRAYFIVGNDVHFDKSNAFDIIGLAFGKELNYNIYLGGRFIEMKNIVWTNLSLFDEGQLRGRVAWQVASFFFFLMEIRSIVGC